MHKSYEYKVQCPVCSFTRYASVMRKRWDGLWVCPEDWEPRNILDFYQPRNDTHKLPFILTDLDGADVITRNAQFLTNPIPSSTKTANYTATIGDGVLYVNCAAGGFTITLPLANASSTGKDLASISIQVIRLDNTGNTLTVTRAGADTVDGGVSTTVTARQLKTFTSDGGTIWVSSL